MILRGKGGRYVMHFYANDISLLAMEDSFELSNSFLLKLTSYDRACRRDKNRNEEVDSKFEVQSFIWLIRRFIGTLLLCELIRANQPTTQPVTQTSPRVLKFNIPHVYISEQCELRLDTNFVLVLYHQIYINFTDFYHEKRDLWDTVCVGRLVSRLVTLLLLVCERPLLPLPNSLLPLIHSVSFSKASQRGPISEKIYRYQMSRLCVTISWFSKRFLTATDGQTTGLWVLLKQGRSP